MEGWVNSWVRSRIFSLTGIWRSLTDLVGQLKGESPLWDCDDITEEMVRDARRDGYFLSEALVDSNGMVYGVRVSDHSSHAGCITCFGGYYWYIEPQTGSIIRIVERD